MHSSDLALLHHLHAVSDVVAPVLATVMYDKTASYWDTPLLVNWLAEQDVRDNYHKEIPANF